MLTSNIFDQSIWKEYERQLRELMNAPCSWELPDDNEDPFDLLRDLCRQAEVNGLMNVG